MPKAASDNQADVEEVWAFAEGEYEEVWNTIRHLQGAHFRDMGLQWFLPRIRAEGKPVAWATQVVSVPKSVRGAVEWTYKGEPPSAKKARPDVPLTNVAKVIAVDWRWWQGASGPQRRQKIHEAMAQIAGEKPQKIWASVAQHSGLHEDEQIDIVVTVAKQLKLFEDEAEAAFPKGSNGPRKNEASTTLSGGGKSVTLTSKTAENIDKLLAADAAGE